MCLQFDSLDDDQKAMLKMLHDTCIDESGADEGKIANAMCLIFTIIGPAVNRFIFYLNFAVYLRTGG